MVSISITSAHKVSRLWEANSLLRNGHYIDAIAIYRELLNDSSSELSRQVQFNLDFALYRSGQLPFIQKETIQFELSPAHQIESDPSPNGQWVSIGIDPYFIARQNTEQRLTAGWYLIEFTLESEFKRKVSQIYPDFGSGYAESSSITLHHERGVTTTVSQVIKFEEDVVNLRLDPIRRAGKFRVVQFHLKRLTEAQSLEVITNDLKRSSGRMPQSESIAIGDVYRSYRNKLSERPGQGSYSDWIEDFELPSLPSDEELAKNLGAMIAKPLISIIMPVYNTREEFLRACIESVMKQSYPYWELCMADDASTKSHVRAVIEEYARRDHRIKYVIREKNGHISLASNSALQLATGDYVALLDHDDEIAKDALYFVAQSINQNPGAQVIYSDEDKIDEGGNRSSPHFKSDWNPDLFFSQNYVCHLCIYKRGLLTRVGGFRPGVEGAQDYDLLLRCLPHVTASAIIHIPRILYHWRAFPGSTALASTEKDYTTKAGLKALSEYFSVNGPSGVKASAGLLPNTYRVHWPIPNPAPLVSLLIPTREKKDILEVAVMSILEKTTYQNYEIVILDNGSVEAATLAFFSQIQKKYKNTRVLRYDKPFNFSAINNFGVQHAKGSVIGLINNDVEVISPDWLTEMVSHAIRPEVGCVGAKLYYSDGRIQHGGVIVGLGGVAGHSHKYFDRNNPGYFYRLMLAQAYSAVTGACLLVQKRIYEQVGGLDDENLAVAFNDVDFCLKIRGLGLINVWTPHAELYHHESISRGAEDTPEKQKRFNKEVATMRGRWGRILSSDPYYSPHLTSDLEDFSITERYNDTFEA